MSDDFNDDLLAELLELAQAGSTRDGLITHATLQGVPPDEARAMVVAVMDAVDPSALERFPGPGDDLDSVQPTFPPSEELPEHETRFRQYGQYPEKIAELINSTRVETAAPAEGRDRRTSLQRRGGDDDGDTVTLDGVVYEVNPDTGYAVGSFADIEARAAAGESRDELITAALEAPGINQRGAERVADGALQAVGRDDEVAVGESELREVSGVEEPEFRRPQDLFPAGGEGGEEGDELQRVHDALSGLSGQEALEWIEEHGSELTQGGIDEARNIATTGALSDADWNLVDVELRDLEAELTRGAATVGADPETTPAGEAGEQAEYATSLEAASDAWAEVLGRARPGVTPDPSVIEESMPEGLTPVQQEQFITEARESGERQAIDDRRGELQGQGTEEGEAQIIAEEQIGSLTSLLDTQTPRWLLEFAGGDLSEQQKRRFVDYWNDAYGDFLRDFDTELVPILSRFDGTEAEAQNIASAVLADQEPLIAHSIELPLVSGRRRVSYTDSEMEALRAMGFSNDAITRLVRLGAITDSDDDDQRGTAARIGPLAALVRYHGGGDEFARFNEINQEIGQLEQELGLRPGQWRGMTADERRAHIEERKRVEADQAAVASPRQADLAASQAAQRVDDLAGRIENLFGEEAGFEERGRLPGILAAQNDYRRGIDLYRGDQVMGIIHAVDPALANRIASTGGDLGELDGHDNVEALQIMQRAGMLNRGSTPFEQLGGTIGDSVMRYLSFFDVGAGGGGRGGGAERVRRMVDPAQVREQVQQLWSRLFLSDADDSVVESITANLQKQLDEAPEGMSFDVSSRIMAFLRGQDVYDELYRNKPEGLSEEEYQSQFAAGISDVIGNELDPEALKAGLRTGEYNTAVGRAASTRRLLESSTLRGRWAQAKQTLDRFS